MNDTQKPLHIKLRELRESHNFSQKDVADYLNLSRQAISQWETGKVYPDIENIVLLCQLYKVSSDELLDICLSQDKNIEETKLAHNSTYDTNTILEVLSLLIILLLTSRIPFIGIITTIIVAFFLNRSKRNYRIVYALCIVCFLIGMYNTLILTKYYIDSLRYLL